MPEGRWILTEQRARLLHQVERQSRAQVFAGHTIGQVIHDPLGRDQELDRAVADEARERLVPAARGERGFERLRRDQHGVEVPEACETDLLGKQAGRAV